MLPMSACAPSPSDWLLRWQHLLAPASRILDIACGSGRHVRHLAALGHQLTGIDRDSAALASLAAACPQAELLEADLEQPQAPWPVAGRQFDAVIVTNYLWRPLWAQILASVQPGGLLLYETFSHGQADYGRPSRPEFLLRPGELLQQCALQAGWQVIAYENGLLPVPGRSQPKVVQRIAARKPHASAAQLPAVWLRPRDNKP